MKLKTALGITLIVLALAAAAYFLIVQAPSAAARKLANQLSADFAKAFQFQPEIRIENRTILGQTKPILELATARKEIWERRRLEHEWMGSVKVFEIDGRFTARAGYDLLQPISFDIEETTKRIRVVVPEAKLLGLELAQIKVVKDENGWWNQLTAKDREESLAALQVSARAKIVESDLLKEASANLERSIQEIVTKSAPGFAVTFERNAAPAQ